MQNTDDVLKNSTIETHIVLTNVNPVNLIKKLELPYDPAIPLWVFIQSK